MAYVPVLNPFAAIEAAINGAATAMLSNAVAEYGGREFGVLFDRAPVDMFGGAVDAASHVCEFQLCRAPGIKTGCEISIAGITYIVASGVQPDESGWVTLGIYPAD